MLTRRAFLRGALIGCGLLVAPGLSRRTSAGVYMVPDLGPGDVTATLQAVLNAEKVITLEDVPYNVFAGLVMQDEQTLQSVSGRGCLRANGAAQVTILSVNGGATGNAYFTADAAESSKVVALGVGGPASIQAAVGSVVQVYDDDAHAHVSELSAVDASTVTLAEPLPWPYTVAKHASVARLVPSRATIQRLVLDGSGNTHPATKGVQLWSTRDVTLEHLVCRGFRGAALAAFTGMGTVVRASRLYTSGSGNEADLSLSFQTRLTVRDVLSLRSTGFGPVIGGSTCGMIDGLSIVSPVDRGFKLQGSAGFRCSNIDVSGCPWPYTGLGVVLGSRKNVFANVRVVNSNIGLWIHGDDNEFTNVMLSGNARDIEVSAPSANNVVAGRFGASVLNQGGLSNRFVHTNNWPSN